MNQLSVLVFNFVFLVGLVLSTSAKNSLKIKPGFEKPQTTSNQISGKVVDKSTGEPIPYCSIALISSTLGTSTNELGEFVLEVDSLPAKLVFSHLNYTQQSFEITSSSNVKIALSPLTTALEEVVVEASKKNSFALELAKKAFKKAEQTSNIDNFSHAFYRQKSKNGDDYSEFSEIFYDIRYGTNGIEDWNIVEGRYALKEDAVYNRNYTLFSRILKPSQPKTDDLILPSHSNFEVYYDLKVNDIIQSDPTKIAVLLFKPKKSIQTPAFEGEVYIDMNTHDILKINWSLARDDLDFVSLTNKNSSWKDYKISYEIVYRRDSLKRPLLNYIKVDQTFDYYVDNNLQSRSSTTSNLTFYEHYNSTSRKRLGTRIKSNQSDWKKLDEIGYNEQFWANNPIIKRTPVEEEVINSFEKADAFSSIFLNSAENIALMSSNISDDPFVKELSMQMNLYGNYNPVEKVFLHTDKNLFAPEEYLWFSAFVVIGPNHQISNASRVLHVDVVAPDGNIVTTQTHELVSGRGNGSLQLPKDLKAGTYQLRAYTQWMQNFNQDFFFTKNIDIVSTEIQTTVADPNENKIDVQFFPEGGNLVASIGSKVAFKAIGNDGLDVNIKGKILDASGKQVAIINTFKRGAGFFQINPQKGEQYVAVLDNGQQYQLPKVADSGYTLTVDNLNDKSVRINVQASESLKNNAFYVVGHMRQRRYYQGRFNFGTKAALRFEVPKSQMPSGVLTLTLFDENKKARCERVVFVNNKEELLISAKLETDKILKRGKIKLQINLTDTDGKPVAADVSIAATDVNQVTKNKNSGTILTQLLLQSDLKGYIDNPGQLFKDEKRATLHALDLVMLTHGWRKFDWSTIGKSHDEKKEFDFAKGIVIRGKARRSNDKPLTEATLNVIAKSGNLLGMLSTETSFDGKFIIPDFNFKGDTELVFNAFNSDNKPVDVKVTLEKNRTKPPKSRFKSGNSKKTDENQDYLDFSAARSKMDALYDFETITALDEVVVTEKKVEQGGSPSIYGQKPDVTVYTADHVAAQTVLQLMGLFAGVTVNGNTVSIRNRGTPLWILDGIPVYNNNPESNNVALQAETPGDASSVFSTMAETLSAGPVPSFIATMDTFTVERVELLKGPRAAIYGSRGANGVILIYTKRGVGQTRAPVLSPDFTVLGHGAEKEFYIPKYDIKREVHDTPDYRATLYWNPSVTTDKEGNATIEFYNSDTAKEIQLSIEGISSTGIPGTYLETFNK